MQQYDGIALSRLHISHLTAEDPPDDLGAPAIEIGVELMAPRAEPVALPVGPATEAAAPSPPVVEQKAEVKPTDLPTEVPNETEEPDRLVTTQESKKPKAEEQEVTATRTAPSAESAAAIAMAPPSAETLRESPRSVAPVSHESRAACASEASCRSSSARHSPLRLGKSMTLMPSPRTRAGAVPAHSTLSDA